MYLGMSSPMFHAMTVIAIVLRMDHSRHMPVPARPQHLAPRQRLARPAGTSTCGFRAGDMRR